MGFGGGRGLGAVTGGAQPRRGRERGTDTCDSAYKKGGLPVESREGNHPKKGLLGVGESVKKTVGKNLRGEGLVETSPKRWVCGD